MFVSSSKESNCSVYLNLYGCETWLLILREECRLRAFENRALRRIFGPRRDVVTGALSPVFLINMIWVTKSRRLRWAWHGACIGESRCACRNLVGKPEGRRPFGRPSHRWEGNITMSVKEMEWGAWTGSVWLRMWTGGGLL
jgi:hypothetical protein